MGSWNDDRLHALNLRVDDGFKAVDKRFDRVEQEVKAGFAKLEELQHFILGAGVTLLIALLLAYVA
jgi:hypothetical protein